MPIPTLGAARCIGKPVIIYGLRDPRDNSLFYVGATTQRLSNRLGGHVTAARYLQTIGRHFDLIRGILADGYSVDIFPLETVKAEDWIEAEQFWIAYFRFIGAALTNKGIGGPGGLGAPASKQRKDRTRAAMKLGHIDRMHTPAARAKAKASNSHAIEYRGVEYLGIKEASRILGVSYGTMQFRLDTGKARRITPREKPGVCFELKGRAAAERHPMRRAVVIDGVEYWGLTAAAAALGVHLATIQRYLRRGRAVYADGKPPLMIGIAKKVARDRL